MISSFHGFVVIGDTTQCVFVMNWDSCVVLEVAVASTEDLCNQTRGAAERWAAVASGSTTLGSTRLVCLVVEAQTIKQHRVVGSVSAAWRLIYFLFVPSFVCLYLDCVFKKLSHDWVLCGIMWSRDHQIAQNTPTVNMDTGDVLVNWWFNLLAII